VVSRTASNFRSLEWDEQHDRATHGDRGKRPYRFEACCLGSLVSVTSDAVEKVPTGGELTLFEAVGRSGLTFFCCVARRRSGMSGVT
jgi:hypothetical protein